MADDAEARKDHDVDLGVPEEPEQVLIKDGIAAASSREECRAEIAVGEKHGERTGEHRYGEQQQESSSPASTRQKAAFYTSVMPGARMLNMVVIILIAPRIDAAPATCSASIVKSMAGPGCPVVESGG